METHPKARDGFVEVRPSRGRLKVWRWTEDPRILIRERINASGGVGYRIVFPRSVTGGAEAFVQDRNFARAKEVARSKGREYRRSQATARVLGDAEKIQAARAVETLREAAVDLPLDAVARLIVETGTRLRPHGIGIADAVDDHAAALDLVKPTGRSLLDVVRFAVDRMTPAGGSKTLGAIVEEMVMMKQGWLERGELRPASFRDFAHRGGRIARDLGGYPVAELTKPAITSWLSGLGEAGRTRKNYRMVLAEILRYAKQRRYLVESPLDELTRDDVKTLEGAGVEAGQPAILSPAEAERLLVQAFERADLDLGGTVVLGLFCGLRTEELKRLQWSAVRLDEAEPFVVVGAEIAKKRRIRNVPIPPNAVEWLRRWPRKSDRVAPNASTSDYRVRFKKLTTAAGIDWPANAMRHSFGTYHFALHSNSLETARRLGHKADDDILFAHYRALATREQGEAYFNLRPSPASTVVVSATFG
jgi:integrase